MGNLEVLYKKKEMLVEHVGSAPVLLYCQPWTWFCARPYVAHHLP